MEFASGDLNLGLKHSLFLNLREDFKHSATTAGFKGQGKRETTNIQTETIPY